MLIGLIRHLPARAARPLQGRSAGVLAGVGPAHRLQRGRVRPRRLEPDQQHFARLVQPGRGFGFDERERAAGALDLRYLCHRVARREHAAHPGGEQQVARLQVGFDGHEGQRQLVLVAGADGNRAYAAAVGLHRDRVLGVADQDDFGRGGVDLRHLAEDAVAVEHGLVLEHAIGRAFVEQHAVPERIEVDVEDRGDQHFFGDARAVRAHFAQAPVFFLQHRESLQLQVGQAQPGGEREVFLPQAAAVSEGPVTQSVARKGKSTARCTG